MRQPWWGVHLVGVAACTSGASTWARQPDPPESGYTGAFEGTSTATRSAVFYSGGRSALWRRLGTGRWRAVLLDHDGSGFSFIGMTDDSHGVALGQQTAWMTSDGGTTW